MICSGETKREERDIMTNHDITIQYTRGTRYVGGFIVLEAVEDA